MGSQPPLLPTRRRRLDHVGERLATGQAAQSPRLPSSQVVGYAPLARLAEESPRLPRRTRHDRDVGKLVVRILGSVPPPQGLYKADDFSSLLEASRHECRVHRMREKRVRCNKDVGARHKNAHRFACEATKEAPKIVMILGREDGEAGKGAPDATIEGWGNPPNTTAPVPELCLLRVRVFPQSVGRVGHDGMNALGRSIGHPGKAVGGDQGEAHTIAGVYARGEGAGADERRAHDARSISGDRLRARAGKRVLSGPSAA